MHVCVKKGEMCASVTNTLFAVLLNSFFEMIRDGSKFSTPLNFLPRPGMSNWRPE